MRRAVISAMVSVAITAAPVLADDVTASIALSYFECVSPVTKPTCVAPDNASKPKSCPGCKSWRRVTIDTDVTAQPAPDYPQPNAFADDVAKQLYGSGLPEGEDGKLVSVAHFYKNFEQYGWVEVAAGQSKEGTLAVLPTTAAVVIDEKANGQERVIYSSTKRDGAIRESDLSVLEAAVGEAKFIVPESFLAQQAEEVPPEQF
jgi:hypothetical protein